MEYDEALSRLRRLAAGSPFAAGDEGAPIQIMDMLEAAGSRFDSLWIAGLHDREWPPPARPNPFLPLALQRLAGAPQSSAERELKYARRLTERLMQSAPAVICSHPTHSGEEPLRISSLIAHLPEAGPVATITPTIAESQYAAATPLGERPSESAPALPPGTSQAGGMSVLAVSTQSRKFLFFEGSTRWRASPLSLCVYCRERCSLSRVRSRRAIGARP